MNPAATKKICLVNGSPRGKKAVSLRLLEYFVDRVPDTADTELRSIDLKSTGIDEPLLRALRSADAVVFSFPLYAYTLPGAFTKLLEDYLEFAETAAALREAPRTKIYALVNCGFPVPETNNEALTVMELFCRRAGLDWRFGIAIGGGLVVAGIGKIPILNMKLRLSYGKIVRDIYSTGGPKPENVTIKPPLPKGMMIRMKDSEWAKKFMAKKA